ncbi:MAG TPA: DUF2147 domain-containing protein [Xanthobacteraceae bacterium]|jgi:uncharacterized protein (DUF2147 family)
MGRKLTLWDFSHGSPRVWEHRSEKPDGSKLVAGAEPTAVGLWEQIDERSGDTHSWFRITERDGVYEGTVAKICSPSTRAEKSSASFVGVKIITGMRRDGTSYQNGTITDPRDGSRYSALMRLSADGQKLEVRGYIGISLLGRSQIWRRLPDDALTHEASEAC